jgi:hypothetical protein
MKSYLKLIPCFLLSLPLFMAAQNFDSKSVVPKSLNKYSFGMSVDAFTEINKSATLKNSPFAFRAEYQEKNPDSDIKEVTYYFDEDNDRPLYEMIIAFNDVKGLDAYCSKKLGKPDNDKQWTRTTRQGYSFKAWRFGSTLVLALALPSTEWEKGWDN